MKEGAGGWLVLCGWTTYECWQRGRDRGREGQLDGNRPQLLCSKNCPTVIPNPWYLTSPTSFRCFRQTQASVSWASACASASFPPLPFPAHRRGKSLEVTPSCPARPQPPSLALLGTAHCPAHSRRPITALISSGHVKTWRPAGRRSGLHASVLISVGKQY